MAIRKSKEENYTVKGSTLDIIKKCENALNIGGFKKINVNPTLNQITANYKTLTVVGQISITLEEKPNGVGLLVVATANTDNLFALFNSPTQKILSQFKDNLK
ncbi:MAG: hypothetical protein ABIP51_01300 [Bacteroidia bacterium]